MPKKKLIPTLKCIIEKSLETPYPKVTPGIFPYTQDTNFWGIQCYSDTSSNVIIYINKKTKKMSIGYVYAQVPKEYVDSITLDSIVESVYKTLLQRNLAPMCESCVCSASYALSDKCDERYTQDSTKKVTKAIY